MNEQSRFSDPQVRVRHRPMSCCRLSCTEQQMSDWRQLMCPKPKSPESCEWLLSQLLYRSAPRAQLLGNIKHTLAMTTYNICLFRNKVYWKTCSKYETENAQTLRDNHVMQLELRATTRKGAGIQCVHMVPTLFYSSYLTITIAIEF